MQPHRWSTEEPHFDNSCTMQDYLSNQMNQMWEVLYVEDSYCEILDLDNIAWEVHASGDGDSNNHIVTFKRIN